MYADKKTQINFANLSLSPSLVPSLSVSEHIWGGGSRSRQQRTSAMVRRTRDSNSSGAAQIIASVQRRRWRASGSVSCRRPEAAARGVGARGRGGGGTGAARGGGVEPALRHARVGGIGTLPRRNGRGREACLSGRRGIRRFQESAS